MAAIDESLIGSLALQAARLRRLVIEMTTSAGSGHPGPSLSAADIVAMLYFHVLRHDPADPGWQARDRFVLSKGHAAPILYAALALCGYFPVSELSTLRRLGSSLPGFPDMTKTAGVEMSSGSLGQGLSFGIGVSLAGRLRGLDHRTYVLLGDGECNEGQVWEAALLAADAGLDTLIAIVDRNDGPSEVGPAASRIGLEPLPAKWEAFGWDVWDVDGHDLRALMHALVGARDRRNGRPQALVARTVKGRGVELVERASQYHMKPVPPDLLADALRGLGDGTDGAPS